ncbi:protein ATAF2-like [Phragmites australis]|uniref:protein ATAF2-like n=1 Tax=Phragmites australis TaxID=29695 RepID=UPI002D76DDAC|nr:protein ATAF2-like [Phragmites australis]
MARSPSPPNKPPCAAFDSHPSDAVLVRSHLRPWIASELKAGTFIHEADVYSVDPADLTREFPPAVAQDGERAWYFFTPLHRKSGRGERKARTVATGDGWWHNEAKSKPVVDGLEGGQQIGHRQSFSFMKKEGGVRVRTGWLMMEIRLERDHGHEAQEEDSLGNRVLCKVYRSPRNPEPSDSKPTAAAAAPGLKAEADDDESSAATASGPKGKADNDDSSDASLAAAASGRKRKSGNEESSAATATAATPGRKEKAADDEHSVETSAAAPARNRKEADDDESSGAASAAASPRKRQADGNSSGAPVTELQVRCPNCGCGFHLDVAEAVVAAAKSKVGTKMEAGIAQVDRPFIKFL